MQSGGMDPQQAARHLETIRTLMERTALYRRALGPMTLMTGGLGCVAAVVGWLADIGSPRGFGMYWMVVGCVGLGGAFAVVRRQALRAREPFWSPPTRRVTQALLPALVAGVCAGLIAVWPGWRDPLQMWWLPGVWMVLYGLAMHASGFFMARGIRWFGWIFVLAGCALLAVLTERSYASGMPALRHAHWLMGTTFGGLHLAYGVYLHLTEPRLDTT
jgi:hypothetical protein